MNPGRRIIGSKSLLSAILCAALFMVCRAEAETSVELIDHGQGRYHVEGGFNVDASTQIVWDVLTDYEHIDSFVSTLRDSRVIESRPGQVLLEQEAVGRLLFFTRQVRVQLRVVENPPLRIDFAEVSKKDFSSYQGFWEVRSGASGVYVLYVLDCERRFKVPNFMARDVMKRSVHQQMDDVRKEIVRRTLGGSR